MLCFRVICLLFSACNELAFARDENIKLFYELFPCGRVNTNHPECLEAKIRAEVTNYFKEAAAYLKSDGKDKIKLKSFESSRDKISGYKLFFAGYTKVANLSQRDSSYTTMSLCVNGSTKVEHSKTLIPKFEEFDEKKLMERLKSDKILDSVAIEKEVYERRKFSELKNMNFNETSDGESIIGQKVLEFNTNFDESSEREAIIGQKVLELMALRVRKFEEQYVKAERNRYGIDGLVDYVIRCEGGEDHFFFISEGQLYIYQTFVLIAPKI